MVVHQTSFSDHLSYTSSTIVTCNTGCCDRVAPLALVTTTTGVRVGFGPTAELGCATGFLLIDVFFSNHMLAQHDFPLRETVVPSTAQSPWHVGCRFSAVGSTDHFDWFMDYLVGFFTSSLVSYTEKLKSLNAVNMNSPVMHDAVSTQYELLPFHRGVPVAFPAPTKCIRFLDRVGFRPTSEFGRRYGHLPFMVSCSSQTRCCACLPLAKTARRSTRLV